VPGFNDDWSAYADAVPGECHNDEWEAVRDYGGKLTQAEAAFFFPQFDPEKYRR